MTFPMLVTEFKSFVERETRIELATLCLGSKCSTTELLPLGHMRICGASRTVNGDQASGTRNGPMSVTCHLDHGGEI